MSITHQSKVQGGEVWRSNSLRQEEGGNILAGTHEITTIMN